MNVQDVDDCVAKQGAARRERYSVSLDAIPLASSLRYAAAAKSAALYWTASAMLGGDVELDLC
jgi:hypothetical protein